MTSRAGNVGEWSELYVLGFLLANGGAFAADSNQRPIPSSFYKVLEVFLDGQNPGSSHKYIILEETVESLAPDGEASLIERSEIKEAITKLFKALTSGAHSKTFSLPEGAELIELLARDRIAAPSSQNSHDLELVMLDRVSAQPSPRVGFSIKSQIGQPSTLLNASGATNLTFCIESSKPLDPETLLALNSTGLKGRLDALSSLGGTLRFLDFDSSRFKQNLLLLDSRMPEYIAELVMSFYLNKDSTVAGVCNSVFKEGVGQAEQPRFKVKQFLGAVAMGLRPAQRWDGDITKFKGLILAKLDGDVLFYYLYNINEFQEFLFQSLKFEVASTSRHGFGRIYFEGDQPRIKLNLQVRFVR